MRSSEKEAVLTAARSGSKGTMVSKICFVYMVLIGVGVLLLTIFLRDANNRMFYQLRTYRVQSNQLKQQLWDRQLELERLTNPDSVMKQVEPGKTARP